MPTIAPTMTAGRFHSNPIRLRPASVRGEAGRLQEARHVRFAASGAVGAAAGGGSGLRNAAARNGAIRGSGGNSASAGGAAFGSGCIGWGGGGRSAFGSIGGGPLMKWAELRKLTARGRCTGAGSRLTPINSS